MESNPRKLLPKILFAARFFYPLIGGAEHAANIILREFARHGHKIGAVCVGKAKRFKENGVSVVVVRKPNEFFREIKTSSPGLLFTQLDLAPMVVRIAKVMGIPTVITIPSYEALCPTPMKMLTCSRNCKTCRHWLKLRGVMKEQGWAVKNADVVHCCSRYMAKIIKEFFGLQARIVPAPIDFTSGYIVPPIARKGRYITMCTAYDIKGTKTFAEIARRMPEEKFLIVGRGEPKQFGLDRLSNVTCWSYTRPRNFYKVTKLILAPALWPEPFGRTPLEAMANGIPVIASKIGGLPESVGTAGILIKDYKNPEAWVKNIKKIIADEKLYRYYVDSGRKHCKRFSVDRLFPKYKKIFQRAMEK